MPSIECRVWSAEALGPQVRVVLVGHSAGGRLVVWAAAPSRARSHGERRQLEVAVALACEPRLLDEPAAGMSPAETERFTHLIRALAHEITAVGCRPAKRLIGVG